MHRRSVRAVLLLVGYAVTFAFGTCFGEPVRLAVTDLVGLEGW
jgi:hypothetical protein